MRRFFVALAAAVSLSAVAAPGAWAACDVTWDGDGPTDSWHDGTNWNTDVAPGNGQTVCIGAGVGPVIHDNGTPAAYGALSTLSPVTFANGPVLFNPNLGEQSSLGALITLNNAIVEFLETTDMEFAGAISMSSGSILNNSGTFLISNDGDVTGGRLQNLPSGVLTKRTTAGEGAIQGQFVNTGQVNVEAGTLSLHASGPGTHSGNWTSTGTGTLRFAGGNFTLSAGTVTGAATNQVEVLGTVTSQAGASWMVPSTVVQGSGNLSLLGNADITGTLRVDTSGTVTIDDPIATANVFQSAGTLTGQGSISAASYSWTGGTTSGTGTTTFTNTLAIDGPATKTQARPFVIAGAGATMNGTGTLLTNGQITVLSGGQLDLLSNAVLSGTGTLNVSPGGTLRKTGGTGTSLVGAAHNMDGSVAVQTGTLAMGGSSSGVDSGNWAVSDGARLRFPSATHTLSGTVSGSPADGRVQVETTVTTTGAWIPFHTEVLPGANLSLNGPVDVGILTVSGGLVTLNDGIEPNFVNHVGGTIAGTGTITTGNYDWAGGTTQGPGATILTNNFELTGSGTKTAVGRPMQVNGNDATLKDSGDLALNSGSSLTIGALARLDIQSSGDIVTTTAPGSLVVTAAGVLRKSTSAVDSIISTPIDMDGTVEHQAGVLFFTGGDAQGASSGGTWSLTAASVALVFGAQTGVQTTLAASGNVAAATKVVEVSSGSVVSNGTWTTSITNTSGVASSLVLNGTNTIAGVNNNGTLTVNNDSISPSTMSQTGGTINGNAAIIAGTYTWTAGTHSGSGTTAVGTALNLPGAGAKTLLGRTLNAQGGGTHDGGGALNVDNGAHLTIGNVFTLSNGSDIAAAGPGTSLFSVFGSGILRVSGGISDIAPRIDMDGTAQVQSNGRMRILGGDHDGASSSGGPWEVTSGALEFSPATPLTLVGQVNASITQVEFNAGQTTVNGSFNVRDVFVRGGTAALNTTADIVNQLLIDSGTVTVNDPISPLRVDLNGGMLNGAQPVTTNVLNWAGGTMGGSGTTTLNSGGGLVGQLNGTATKTLQDTRQLVLNGITTWSNTGNLAINNSARLTANALFSGPTDADMTGTGSLRIGSPNGIFRKEASSGTTSIGPTIENDGNVDIQSGMLRIDGGGTPSTANDGTWTQGPGGALELAPAQTLTLNGGLSATSSFVRQVSGTTAANGAWNTSQTVLQGGTLTLNNASTTVTGNLTVSGGQLNLNNSIAPSSVDLDGGLIAGVGGLTSGNFEWRGGTLGGSGATTVLSGGALDVLAGTAKTLNGRTITNNGTVNVGVSGLAIESAGRLINNGQLNIIGDVGIASASQTGGIVNASSGTLRKTSGGGVSPLTVHLENDGTVQGQSGTISFAQGDIPGTQSQGTWVLSIGKQFIFSGTRTIAAPGSVTGPPESIVLSSGTLTVDSGATYNVGQTTVLGGTMTFNGDTSIPTRLSILAGTVNANDAIAPTLLELTGGNIDGTAAVDPGGFVWTSGHLGGTGSTTVSNSTSISGSGQKSVSRALTLDDATMTGTGNLALQGSSVLTLGGELHIASGADVTGSGTSRLNVGPLGTLLKSTDDTTIGATLNNDGTISVQSGSLALTGTFDNWNSGTKTLTGGRYELTAPLRFTGADVVTNAAFVELVDSGQITDTQGTPLDGLRNLATNAATGTLRMFDKAHTVSGALTNNGVVDMRDASTLSTGGNQPYTQADGETVVRDTATTLRAPGSSVVVTGGFLTGTGTVEPALTNDGTVSPGNSPGALTVNGSYTQTPDGLLLLTVNGDEPEDHDKLVVTGAATLAGTLQIVQAGGFDPPLATAIDAIDYASHTGSFTAVTGALFGSGKRWRPVYGATGMDLVVSAPPVVSIDDVTVTEGTGVNPTASFTVSLSAEHTETVTVNAATTPGSATAPADFTAANSVVSFGPGQTSRTFDVTVAADALDEDAESFLVTLSSPALATLGDATANGNITDDDAAPGATVGNVTVTEGNSGTVDAQFEVTLSSASGKTATVTAVASDGSATAPADYTGTSAPLTFTPGQTTKTVTVPVKGDVLDEADEAFSVGLTTPVNLTPGAAGTGTITDDDAAPTVSVGDVTVTEGNSGTSNAVFTLALSAVSGKAITVNAATADGSAVAPGDYGAASGPVSFAAGETSKTVAVAVVGDTADEPNETFSLGLSAPSNVGIADGTGTGTINDDDEPAPAEQPPAGGGGGTQTPPAGGTTQTPPAGTTAAAALAARDVLTLPSASKCVKRGGKLKGVRFKRPAGAALKRVEVKVNGKRILKLVRAKIGTKLDVPVAKTIKKPFTLGFVVVTEDGRRVTSSRKYKVCR